MSSEHIKRINTYDGEKQIDYNSLANLPEIPQGTKDLVNDAGYLTVIPPPTNATLGGIKAQPRGLEDTAEAKLGADGKLYVNVLKNELDIQTKRIDSILSLENGSTTGDAELLDIRLGYDGTEYSSAGEAVRNQVKGVPNYGILVGNYIKFYRSSEEGDSDILLYEIDVTALLESGLSLENLQLSCETEDNIIILYMNDGKIEKSIELPIIVDDALSISSTNPVQNRVITEQLNYVIEEIENIKENGIGGGEGVTVRLTNQNGSATLVGSYGNAISLMFTFTSTENDLPTGNANLKITVNSIQKVNMSIPQGLTSIDVAPYLNIGNNTVIVTCTDIYGKSRSLVYDVSVIRLSIESTFNAAMAYESDILFKYKPYGAVEKTIHFVVDGTEIGTVVTSLSGKDMSRTIPKMSHGAHRLEVYSTATLNDTKLTSPKLVYDVICIEEGNTTPIIASVYEVETLNQGEQVSIPYIVYDPTKLACDITLTIYTMEAGSEIIYNTQNITVDRSQQEWNTRKYPIGDVYFRISYGDISPKVHMVSVVESKIKIDIETNDLELNLTSEGRSNNETTPGQWVYGNITTTFDNMNWNSVGWINDENGDACLRLNGDATATINFKPFAEDIRTYGKTIELIFAIRDVNNREAIPISCMNGDIGFEVKADTAYIRSEQSEVFCNYKEEERVHLAFVIESKDEYRMLSVYLNGVMSDAIQYPATDNFQQNEPVNISVGSPYCGVDLYSVRSYTTALPDSSLTTNYIADISDIVRKTEAYENNDIYDDFGQISFSDAIKKNSVMVIIGELPTYKGDKKKCKVVYYDVEDSNLNWEEFDVSIDVQGTSSQWYVRKNWKLKTPNEHYIDVDQLPGKVICIKVDYAEATGTHNTQNAVFVEKLYSEKIPPQETNPKVRTTIYGKPILLFHQEAEGMEPVFYGKANYNFDKGAENVFGFTSDYDVECWEFKNNTSEACLFTGEIPTKWSEDFEARYPDGYSNISRFKIMHDWVVSTRQNAATGNALASTYTDVDGNTHTHDTREYRLAKFKTEFENYFDMHYSLIYYVYTFFALMTDQRAKNMFLTYWGSVGKWYFYFYDNDTAFGINNEGSLVFDYYHEDSDQVDGANVYNGQLSTLWVNFKQAFPDLIQETYQDLRSNSILNYDELINQFITKGSDKWSESVYNEDGDFKYVSMLRSENDATNLPQIRGTGEEHFRYFIENRLNYCDSKWYAGDYPEDNAVVRIYTPVDENGIPLTDLAISANANITVTPYSNMYAGVRYKANGTLMQERLEANETYTFEAPNEIFNDTETAIYGASHLSSLGDLAPLYLGYVDVGAATKLVELKIGDGTEGYKNANLYHLAVGTNRLLKKIDIQNCDSPRFVQALVLTGCPNIEEVYAKGSSITGVELPDSGYLKILQLPSTITNLTLKNQFYIEDLTIEGLDRLKTLTIENTPVDTLGILSNAVNVERVRLTDVDWHYDDASILYELINRDIGGIDENGTNTDTMWIDGKCHIEYLTGEEFAEIKRLYPYLDITYTTLESQLVYMSEDGQTELHRETILNGGNGTDPVTNGTIPTPTKEATAQYVFTHGGWSLTIGGDVNDNALIGIEADRVVYVSFTKAIRYYTVNFYNGNYLLSSVLTAYGKDGVPCKKNLFNIKSFNMDKVTNNGDGSLTLTGYIPFKSILDTVCCNLKIGETYIWSGSNLTQIHFGGKLILSNEPFVFTQDMFEANTIGFYAKGTTSESSPYTISNIQLERGSMVTTYEPYTTITPTRTDVDNPEDFEFIGWKPEPTNIQGDTDCYAQYYDTREIMDDWTTIATACLDGTATDKYAIGAYKPITIEYNKLSYDFYDGCAVVYNDEIHILGGAESVRNHYKFNGEEWVKVSTLPYDLYWGSAIIYNDEIHILGSYANGQSKTHYKYNDTDGWVEASTLPVFFSRGSVVVYNDEIHMIGGLGNATHYKYNPTDGWILISAIDAFYDGGAVVLDDKIHIFGGSTVKGHRVYDGTEWAVLDDLPYSMIRGQAIIYNNEAHILGSDYSPGDSISHYILNASGAYSKTYDLPYYCSRFATVIYNDKIHILGGYGVNIRKSHYLLDSGEWVPNGEYETIDMEVIAHNHDELTDGVYKWEKVGTLPDSSYMNAVVTLNNEAYIFNTNYKLYKYDGTTYTHLADLDAYPIRETLVVYNDEIHFLNGTNHYKWNGTELSVVCTLPIDSTGSTMAVYNGEMYWFGNVNASYRANCYKWSGTEWVALSAMPHAIYNGVAITYQDKLHVLNQGGHFTFDGSNWVHLLNLPKSTNNASAIVWKDEMYLIGGSSTNRMLYKYNGESWIEFGTLPYPFSVGGAVVFNDEIHIFGGDGVAYRSNHWRYAGARWESDVETPKGASYCDSIVFNNLLYYLSNNTDLYKFDGVEWTSMITLPCPVKMGLYKGNLYFVSNVRDSTSEYCNKVYKYDGTELIEIADYPGVNNAPSIVEYNNELCVIGGHYVTHKNYFGWNGSEWVEHVYTGDTPLQETGPFFIYNGELHSITLNKHYRLNPDTDVWEVLEILPYSVAYYGISRSRVTVRDNEIYVISTDENDKTSLIQKYDGENWTIIRIPGHNDLGGSNLCNFRDKIHLINGIGGRKHLVLRNPRATLTFLAKNALNETKSLGQDFSSWSDSTLHTFVNDTLFGSLPSMLRDNIKEVVKMCDGGYENQIITTLNERCWIPSATELGFDSVDSINNYYLQGQGDAYPVFTDGLSRVRTSSDGISKIWYFTRTSDCSDNTKWIFVIHTGAANRTAKISNQSVVFGFCI